MSAGSCRHTDPMTGVVAEVGTDGVPVGLALPDDLLRHTSSEVARAVLRTLTAAAADARELLDRIAEEDWDGQELENAGWDDPTPEDDRWDRDDLWDETIHGDDPWAVDGDGDPDGDLYGVVR